MATTQVPDRIAVIGAAGGTGQPIVRALLRRGANVRALVRRPDQSSLFADLVDCRVVELDDRATLTDALRGAAAAYYIPPVFNTAEERFGDNVIAAAGAAGVARLVYHSVLHAPTPEMPHHARKARVELALRNSALEWTIVQPAMYVQTPLTFLDPEKRTFSPGFDVDRPFNPIALDDLAEAVATILSERGYEFGTFELAGCERLTFADMANIISEVRGVQVNAIARSPERVVEQARSSGTAAGAGEELRLMMEYYNGHGLVGNGKVLRMILGREPTSFKVAVEQAFAGA